MKFSYQSLYDIEGILIGLVDLSFYHDDDSDDDCEDDIGDL